jgi:hypothetical protein
MGGWRSLELKSGSRSLTGGADAWMGIYNRARRPLRGPDAVATAKARGSHVKDQARRRVSTRSYSRTRFIRRSAAFSRQRLPELGTRDATHAADAGCGGCTVRRNDSTAARCRNIWSLPNCMPSRSCQWVSHSGTLFQVTAVMPIDWQMAQACSSLLLCTIFFSLSSHR